MADVRLKSRPDSVLEDPGALAVATLYAQSYMTAAKSNGVSDPAAELNSFVTEVLGGFPEFQELLMSDAVGRDDKLGIIDRVIAPRCSEFFANFLRVLVRHGRIDMIVLIQTVFQRLQEQAAGKQRVRVRTARALSDSSRGQIKESLKNKLGFEPILQESVDASLLGGMVLQVGDTVFDSSLRSRLKQLQGRLVEKAFNEIQSGRDRFSHPEGD
ncbi:MAG: ATP synthase F1 subunit delta [Planctomycetaceae bacterium]|nr:ATP synthase F1 subunit delta [Planctomycetaceae bacterium]